MSVEVIPVSRPFIGAKELEYVSEAVRSGWVSSLGRYIDVFEKEFASYVGVEHAIATSNGTTGLHLALCALGIGPGDEVIVPDLTFVATANAVAYTGAKPVPVDIDPLTLCLDPKRRRRRHYGQDQGHGACTSVWTAVRHGCAQRPRHPKPACMWSRTLRRPMAPSTRGSASAALGTSGSSVSTATRSSPAGKAEFSPPTTVSSTNARASSATTR